MYNNRVIRVLILTDSLGCPRDETNVANTWTDRILRKWSSNNLVFYTKCTHGLSAKDIIVSDICELEPDIVFCQIGIVDACRNVWTEKEFRFISSIPYVSKLIRRISRKYHYNLTKLRNVHSTSLDDFQKKLQEMIDACPKTAFYFIGIAKPGTFLRNITYHSVEDSIEYDNILRELKNPRGGYLNPYEDYEDSNHYVLPSDGHHLNELGLDLVFHAVDDILENTHCKV